MAIDNLHRQVAHREKSVGKPKVESLKKAINELVSTLSCLSDFAYFINLKFLLGNFCGFETLVNFSLNSMVNVVLHNVLLDKECALDIIGPYEIVVDCSDNPATR